MHGKQWYETELQCIMYIVFATYLSADPKTTLKILNSLTSPTKDEPNLGNQMKCSVSDLWRPQLQHSLIGIRIGKLRQPRSILAENRVPLRQLQPVWFRPRMHSTGQATWLPPSFPHSHVCVSFSFSPRRFFIFFQLLLKEIKKDKKGPRKK